MQTPSELIALRSMQEKHFDRSSAKHEAQPSIKH